MWQMLHSLNHLHGHFLHSLQYVHVLLLVGSPELGTVLALKSHQC